MQKAVSMKGLLSVAAMLMLVAGCHCPSEFAQAVFFEPLHYCNPHQECLVSSQNYAIAETHWREVQRQCGEQTFSTDYAQGYIEGFADYLERGPAGGPPAIPPQRYWNVGYQSPTGHQAIQEWFAGFEDGTAAAVESGYRQFRTIPTSWKGPAPDDV
jgi:hypothetical protein